jgi:glycosyltransferase involved in cell wall biosynthesis
VQSVLAQTWSAFELIVVDDGSNDGMLASIADISDERLRYLLCRNGGQAAARNIGVQAARAEWIAFLDADDLWLPGHLAELNNIRTRCPQAALIGTAFLDSDARGCFAPPANEPAAIGPISYFECFARAGRPFFISSCAVRRRAFEESGGFRALLRGEDSEFAARIALAHPVAASSRPTVVYVHGHGGFVERLIKAWKRTGIQPPIESAADLSSAVDLLLRHEGEVGRERMPKGIDAFIDSYVDSRLLTALYVGDVRSARIVRRFRRGPAAWRHRALSALASLPAPLLKLSWRLAAATKRAMVGPSKPGRRA